MGYRYEKCDKNSTYVIVPCEVDGEPLTTVGAKAFLSCRRVERLELPDTLEQVEDWAFAHMKGLKEMTFPAKEILFGKKVFLGCDGLRRIILTRGGEPLQEQYEGMPFFLASVFRLSLDNIQGRLSDLSMAGDAEAQWQWLSCYDEAVSAYLRRPDDQDFEPAFIGWFDVEDVDDQKAGYMATRRREKIALVFQRMMYPERMALQTEELFGEYLVRKTPEQVLEMMRENGEGFGGCVKYFQIWRQLGGFECYSPKFLLEELRDADPEVRSYLLECELENAAGEDFFGGLEL